MANAKKVDIVISRTGVYDTSAKEMDVGQHSVDAAFADSLIKHKMAVLAADAPKTPKVKDQSAELAALSAKVTELESALEAEKAKSAELDAALVELKKAPEPEKK